MPFISDTAKRSVLQTATPDINIPQAGFSETFAASVGLTIDENLSISQSLNREGWQNRQELIRQKIDEDSLNRDDYMDRRGRFDYNRAAADLNDPSIKTDQVLEQERRDMLAVRRKYADDVLERGNGMAQFLGMANAYMLDPISIATMPIALPATGAKSLSIAGRSLLAARNAAVIETATELAIQPFVYEHKQDIESPYTYKDALTNIGASALGGVAGGVSGYLKSVRKATLEKGVVTPEVESALDNIKRMEESIDYGRSKSEPTIKQVSDDNPYLFEVNPKKLSPTETDFKDVLNYKGDAGKPITAVFTDGEYKILDGHHRVKIAGEKGETIKAVFLPEDQYIAMRDRGIHQADMVKEFLASSPEKPLSPVVDVNKAMVKDDIDYLESLEVERELVRRPQVTPAQYDVPESPKASAASTSQRESFILEKEGLADDFNADMQRFNELDDPRIIQDDEVVSAGEFMKSIDDELEGIDSVLTCAYG